MPKNQKRGQRQRHFIRFNTYRRLPLLRSVRAKNILTVILAEVREG